MNTLRRKLHSKKLNERRYDTDNRILFLYAMEKYALIVAGGSGTRMGNITPKQFLMLQNKSLLWHSVHAFHSAFSDIQIILVLPESHLQVDIEKEFSSTNIKFVAGGTTRFQSVKNGLSHVPDDAVVFVHDGVRCLLSTGLITRCYEQTRMKGNAVPVVKATDSLRIDKDNVHCVRDRNHIRMVQTPQTFASTDLKLAFEQPYQDSFTDEATVMEAFGKTVHLIEGEYENIKITRPLDLLIADTILSQRQKA